MSSLSVILDSSVLLAAINREPGYQEAFNLFPYSVMSTVNITEVVGILMARHDIPKGRATNMIDQLIDTIIHFNEKQAIIAGELEVISKRNALGLSLADRACIALGITMELPIYTADRIWTKVNIEGADIRTIR